MTTAIEPTSTASARLAVIAMALLALAMWMLQHPYTGIVHDSTLYTLLALARLHPDTLSADVFLRFGSQDRYTIFSPLYAAAIRRIGLEPAAATLTFAAHLAVLGGAWLVARRFMSALYSTFGVALLLALPGEYGSGAYFHYLEGFLTPRLPAEALVLFAIAATLARRYRLAGGCLVVAMLLHPIMGTVGVAFLVLTFVAPTRPRLIAGVAAIFLASSLAVVMATAPLGRLDPTWLEIVRRSSPFLYVSSWSPGDWGRVAVPLTVLTLGLLTGTMPALRKMCGGALATVACGLAVTFVFCDLLHVVLFTDLQSWRWVWLADILAAVLLPVIAGDCWRSGIAGRIALVLLASAWILKDDGSALYILPVVIACAAVPPAWREHRYMRLALFGACGLLLLAATIDLSARLAYVEPEEASEASLPQQVRSVCANGFVPGMLLIAAWFGLRRIRSTQAGWMFAGSAAALCAPLLWLGWSSWTATHYSAALAGKFAPWRAEIPPNAEVMWPDIPLGAWYLLERPNYWSPHQSVGAIFSREKSLLVRDRTASINAALRAGGLLGDDIKESDLGLVTMLSASKMPAQSLKIACADPALRYVASWQRIGKTPVAPVTIDPAKPNSRIYLYRCTDFTN